MQLKEKSLEKYQAEKSSGNVMNTDIVDTYTRL